ncbi:Quinone oxidoreductase 1 [Candidatus Nitrosocosmicus oleophilus]|uniref:Quinone oxidoreductase 1 n=1 Tax=Candidatus Nitrosocosmicus oleophilus TaxID=1353260 RepID=A0A654M8F2_9ARCH|nr:NADP-dependent oxidoreductase [Candidatus Nitrosocosmicus oleophilus]ALI35772.1 Quinone oxidoreductase 1 [Candidatus Nitrosocosmicus oleophilus]
MKSIQISKYGGSDVVDINNDAPIPRVSTDKVLVEVKASGVNPVDWKIREGYFQQMVPLQFPATLGTDFSGVIKELEQNVSTNFNIGDEVYGQASLLSGGSGSFAELALTNIKSIAVKPKTLNHIEASSLPLVGASTWQGLVDNIGLSKNQKILIHGGAGGIGTIAIQLAKHLGAYVGTTVKSEDKEFVKQLGADEIVDYTTQNFDDILHDYDAAFDTVGGETYKKSFKVLKNNGTIVSMLEQPDSNLMNQYGVKAIFQFTETTSERLTKLVQWIDQNNVKVNVEKTFPLSETAKALDYQKDNHPRGKVVITI